MKTSILRFIVASVASGIVLVASGAAALPSLPRGPTVKLGREARPVEPRNEHARATRQPMTSASHYFASIGRNIATNAKIPNARGTFHRATSRVKACYLRGVEQDETAQGSVVFKLTLAPDGSVEMVEGQTASGSNLPRSVLDCTLRVLHELKFEPPTDYEGNAIVVASASFRNLSPSVRQEPNRATKPRPTRPSAPKKIVRTRI